MNLRLIIVFLLCAIATAASQPLTPHQQLARDVFQELININTSVSVGCSKAAEAMAARLKGAGFPADDIVLAGPAPEHLNLVVRYHGSGAFPPLLFFGHLDVVEALRQDWSFDPFVFREQDGWFYGRGTSDMKCEDADIIATLIRLRSERFVPDRDLIVALTEDEEGGTANGISWLLTNRRQLIDVPFAINLEGGGGDLKGGKPFLMEVQTSEKVYVSFRLEVTNPGGHSSQPVKENAIYRLAAGLLRIGAYDFPIRLNETTRSFFRHAAERETGQMKDDLQAILKTPLDTAAAERLCASLAYYNALMRTTCVVTMLSGGHAENALPQSARAVVNCRMLPDDSIENVLATLHRVLADTLISVTPMNKPRPAPLSPIRKEVLENVERLTSAFWPGVTVTPVMTTGATDGSYFRQLGVPVYGVSGMFFDIDDNRAHGRDERIGVRDFYNGVEFLCRFIEAITGGRK